MSLSSFERGTFQIARSIKTSFIPVYQTNTGNKVATFIPIRKIKLNNKVQEFEEKKRNYITLSFKKNEQIVNYNYVTY